VAASNGTWGARSTSVAGAAIRRGADKILSKACQVAAEVLECGLEDAAWRIRPVAGADRVSLRLQIPPLTAPNCLGGSSLEWTLASSGIHLTQMTP
jgi:Molybdopterin-binding domain of aldehyde dehydrogenase